MTDTNHIEVLRAVRSVFDHIPQPCAERDALDAAITALSARASAGEGGRERDREMFSDAGFNRWLDEYVSDTGHTVYDYIGGHEMIAAAWGGWDAYRYYHSHAPQPAQAGASGGGVDEKHLADCLLMTGHLSREQAEEVASKLRAFVFTPASPATGEEDSPQDISWWVRRLKVQESITDKYVARVAELESSQPTAAQGGEWVTLPRKEWGRLSEAMDYLKRDCADIWWSNFHAARVACQLAAVPQPQVPAGAIAGKPRDATETHRLAAVSGSPPAHGDGEGDAWTYPNRNALIREVCEGLRGYRFDVDPVCVMAIINSIPAQVFSRMAPPVLTARPAPEADARDGRPTVRELIDVLPGVYYMDPPDGGSVSLLEQLQRMAQDAARYRFLKFGGYEHADDGHPYIVVHRQDGYGNWNDTIIEDADADARIDAAMSLPAQGRE